MLRDAYNMKIIRCLELFLFCVFVSSCVDVIDSNDDSQNDDIDRVFIDNNTAYHFFYSASNNSLSITELLDGRLIADNIHVKHETSNQGAHVSFLNEIPLRIVETHKESYLITKLAASPYVVYQINRQAGVAEVMRTDDAHQLLNKVSFMMNCDADSKFIYFTFSPKTRLVSDPIRIDDSIIYSLPLDSLSITNKHELDPVWKCNQSIIIRSSRTGNYWVPQILTEFDGSVYMMLTNRSFEEGNRYQIISLWLMKSSTDDGFVPDHIGEWMIDDSLGVRVFNSSLWSSPDQSIIKICVPDKYLFVFENGATRLEELNSNSSKGSTLQFLDSNGTLRTVDTETQKVRYVAVHVN